MFRIYEKPLMQSNNKCLKISDLIIGSEIFLINTGKMQL